MQFVSGYIHLNTILIHYKTLHDTAKRKIILLKHLNRSIRKDTLSNDDRNETNSKWIFIRISRKNTKITISTSMRDFYVNMNKPRIWLMFLDVQNDHVTIYKPLYFFTIILQLLLFINKKWCGFIGNFKQNMLKCWCRSEAHVPKSFVYSVGLLFH